MYLTSLFIFYLPFYLTHVFAGRGPQVAGHGGNGIDPFSPFDSAADRMRATPTISWPNWVKVVEDASGRSDVWEDGNHPPKSHSQSSEGPSMGPAGARMHGGGRDSSGEYDDDRKDADQQVRPDSTDAFPGIRQRSEGLLPLPPPGAPGFLPLLPFVGPMPPIPPPPFLGPWNTVLMVSERSLWLWFVHVCSVHSLVVIVRGKSC